jgi:ribose-phosphate pyrophosphokinase
MNTINLIYPEKSTVPFECIVFPDGQPHIKINPVALNSLDKTAPISIYSRISSANELLLVLLIKNILDYHEFEKIELHISYLLAARMDRVMTDGEPFTLKVIAGMLNTANFKKIRIFDPHSEVSTALLNRSYTVNNHSFVKEALAHYWKTNPAEKHCIVSPDAGALKKIHSLANYLGIDQVVECMKERDVKTGALTNFTTTASNLQGFTCFIVDDLCDGGGTFIGTAKLLKSLGANKVILVVSHGIFSKGTVLEGIDAIYCTDSYKQIDNINCFPISNYLLP